MPYHGTVGAVTDAASLDYLKLALSLGRSEFVAAHPFPFLVGLPAPPRPAPKHTTAILPIDDWADPTSTRDAILRLPATPPAAEGPVVAAVRKIRSEFPSMITVGRTANNDIVLADPSVSRFHAYFQVKVERADQPERTEQIDLKDAGSRNGTWAGDRPVHGTPTPVTFGETVRFGDVRLQLVTADECWTWVRQIP